MVSFGLETVKCYGPERDAEPDKSPAGLLRRGFDFYNPNFYARRAQAANLRCELTQHVM